MNSDYGRHVTELRRRARRPDPKKRKARKDKRKAIEQSKREG